MSMIGPAVLRQVSLFATLDEDHLQAIADCLRRRRYVRDQVIFAEDDPGTSLCIVEEGMVKVVRSSPDGREVVLNTFGPGDVFGELALLDGAPRSADAVAEGPCRLLLLARDDFFRFLEAHPRVALQLLVILTRKLRHTTNQVQDLVFFDVPARLARALLELAEPGEGPGGDGKAPTARVTQAGLAARIGTTRESVNKWLAHFESQGIIRHERGRVTILRPQALRKRIY
jgi:CRP/FNR family transcriptional regulator, cyclic AMP receptor protein